MSETSPRIHLLSYNIHKGFSQGRSFVLNGIKEAIRTVHADLVFLQEVIGEHKGHARRVVGWPTTNQFEYLADSLWPHHAYGKNAVYDEGHHGNAILSMYPISLHENIDVSTNRFERRGLLHSIIDVPGHHKPLHVICTHLDLFERGRTLQTQRLCARIESHVPHDCPLIIAGDFNDWRETITEPLEEVLEVQEVFKTFIGQHARSFPSWLPLLPLDRVYCRGMKIHAARVLEDGPWRQLSDHCPLYVELEIEEQPVLG